MFYKKIWGLALIFGGEPDQYTEYAEKHREERPKEVFKAYALENGLTEEQFNEKFVNFRLQKLSKMFGNPVEKYRAFVQENIDLPQRELMDLIYEKGIEKREDKKCWWGRRFNFNEPTKEEKEASPKKSPKKEKSAKKEKSEKKNASKDRKRRSPPMEEPKPLDTPEIVKAKGSIMLKMREIFGSEEQFKHMKFIDTYFPLGEERIIDLWMQQ